MKLKTKFMKNEIQTAAAKQEYQAPLLSELGNVAELTLAAAVSGSDGGAQSAN